eukprot:8541824-Heterocapsa_arctica.AAC.1
MYRAALGAHRAIRVEFGNPAERRLVHIRQRFRGLLVAPQDGAVPRVLPELVVHLVEVLDRGCVRLGSDPRPG